MFPGGSSNGCKEADVVEISQPINRASKTKLLKQKEVKERFFIFIFIIFLNILTKFYFVLSYALYSGE